MIANQKGGVGKTTTTINIGVGLARMGKKVLLIDADSQGDLSIALGNLHPDETDAALPSLIADRLIEKNTCVKEFIEHHEEGVDYLSSNIELSGIEFSLVNTMRREYVLSQIIDEIKGEYDYIIIDCSSSIGMMTINALVAADSVIIPVQAEYLSAKGLEQLIRTIYKAKNNHLNPDLQIGGILLTMVDRRTTLCKKIVELIENLYGKNIRIFSTRIPKSVRASEMTASGRSIFTYDGTGKVAAAYDDLTKEILNHEE